MVARNVDKCLETFEAASAAQWRSWLRENHLGSLGVWLVFRKIGSDVQTISYDEALEEALSYGWVDSLIKKLDGRRYARKFTPRRPRSVWSKSNVDRVNKLISERRMTKWGLDSFAKRTSDISLLEKFNLEGVHIPQDLEEALKANKRAWTNFERFGESYRKRYLIWIEGAKRPETRKRRVAEAVELISRNVKALLK